MKQKYVILGIKIALQAFSIISQRHIKAEIVEGKMLQDINFNDVLSVNKL